VREGLGGHSDVCCLGDLDDLYFLVSPWFEFFLGGGVVVVVVSRVWRLPPINYYYNYLQL